MENLNRDNITENFFDAEKRLEKEKREKIRGEIKSDLGGELEKFIFKKYHSRGGKVFDVIERIRQNNLEVDDLEEIESMVKEINNYANCPPIICTADEIIRFKVLAEELDSYLETV